jgi:hypothetical protein
VEKKKRRRERKKEVSPKLGLLIIDDDHTWCIYIYMYVLESSHIESRKGEPAGVWQGEIFQSTIN